MEESKIPPINFNVLIEEIESGSSGSSANVIRKLREHEVLAYQAGVGGPTGELIALFVSRLDARCAEHNLEIEKTCSYHYQSFVDSTRELLNIQHNVSEIGQNLESLNTELEESVVKFVESCNKLSECKLTLDHVEQCIEAIQISLPILEQYSRIEQSISEGRFYHALKTLEDLEHSQLDLIRPFIFSEIISHRVPKTKASIKNASLAELTDFLEHIRKNSVVLGALAMYEAAQSSGMDSDALLGSIVSNGFGENETQSTISLGSNLKNSKDSKFVTRISGGILDKLDNELDLLTQIVNGKISLGSQNINSNDTTNNKNNDGSNSTTQYFSQTHSRTKDLVDFGPVYRCLHIHSALNERSEFERHYCTQRRKQCQLILSLSPNQQANMRNYAEFFSSVCGFFVVDDFLRHTLPGSSAFYQTYLDELWLNTVNRLTDFARSNASTCSSIHDLIRLKDYTIIFEHTMKDLGFPIAGISEMIRLIQRKYHSILSSRFQSKFEKIINEDNFTSIRLNNSNDLKEFLQIYPPGDTIEFTELPFPKPLCFSWMVPHLYKSLREYIDLCHQFCDNMNLAFTELEDVINRAVNTLFTECLHVVLMSSIKKSARDLSRLTQFCINLDELETVCGHLDNYLHFSLIKDNDSSFHGNNSKDDVMIKNGKLDFEPNMSLSLNTGANPPRSKLHGATLLKDARALAESQIYSHLNKSVAQFVILSNYDETNDKSSSMNDTETTELNPMDHNRTLKPSNNIVELTSWLKATFDLFANLPPKVSQTACFSVCKHIARLLYDVLFGTQVRMLSDLGLQQLNLDLAQCEAFARSQPVPGLDPTTLWLIFADLRQLLDLYHKDDWSVYISMRKKPEGNPYDRVPPSVAIKLLERVRESEKKRTGFLQSMRKEERERRKRYDDIIRQLRGLNISPRND